MYLYNKSLNTKILIIISKIDWVPAFFPKLLFYIVKTPKNSQIYSVSSVSPCFHLCHGSNDWGGKTLLHIMSAFP